MEVQKSSASWDAGGTTLDEVGTEKPEIRLGCLSSQAGAVHQEQQPAATKRYVLFCHCTFVGPEQMLTISLTISIQYIHNSRLNLEIRYYL